MTRQDPPTHSGDTETVAFVELLLQHRHALYAFITKLLVNKADVEDVFQRTSLVLWKKLDEFDPDGSFFHWACGIAYNEVRNVLTVKRRSRLHFDVELLELLAHEAAAERETSDARLAALRTCIERLSSRQQEILRRCYVETTTITEVAATLGRERGALYKQLARLRSTLMQCILRRLSLEGVG